MNNQDFYELYSTTLDKVRHSGGDEYMALCPFHEDTHESLGFNRYKGVYNCFVCGGGTAYEYAVKINLPNPHQYMLNDNSNSTNYIPYDKPAKTTTITIDLNQRYDKYKKNLLNNKDKFPSDVWDIELIDELGVGMSDKGNWTFKYIDAIKLHKEPPYWDKNKKFKAMWYPPNKTSEYRRDKELIICEGEKDVITLISAKFQAISSSNGCQSIPYNKEGKYDIDIFKDWTTWITICYDAIDGVKGANKLGNAIKDKYPHLKVRIAQWDEKFKKGFDVYDSFVLDDGVSFTQALNNAKEIKEQIKKGEMDMLTIEQAMVRDIPPQKMIIENMLPEKTQIVLGGTEGANKSFMAMQMAMAIANDDNEFFGFNMNVKGLKVLYFDSECGVDRLTRRIQAMHPHFSWKNKDRIVFASKRGTLNEIYEKLEIEIENHKPDIVVIDCLYNTTEGDISKNHHLKPTLQKITDMMIKYDLTILLIAHMNKGEHDKGLMFDRVSGGSYLKNWTEHCILLTKSNEQNIRLMRFDKSRDTGTPQCYYELEWDYPMLRNVGVSTNWKELLITSEKKDKWKNILHDLADEFTTLDFKNVVVNSRKMSEKTATNYLSSMLSAGVLKKIRHGEYKKNLELRG